MAATSTMTSIITTTTTTITATTTTTITYYFRLLFNWLTLLKLFQIMPGTSDVLEQHCCRPDELPTTKPSLSKQ